MLKPVGSRLRHQFPYCSRTHKRSRAPDPLELRPPSDLGSTSQIRTRMISSSMDEERIAKRRRLHLVDNDDDQSVSLSTLHTKESATTLALSASTSTSSSLTHPISPPAIKRSKKVSIDLTKDDNPQTSGSVAPDVSKQHTSSGTELPSPIHLTKVEGLSSALNLDTFSLQDLVGDPLIRECWVFNYLFDVEFLM